MIKLILPVEINKEIASRYQDVSRKFLLDRTLSMDNVNNVCNRRLSFFLLLISIYHDYHCLHTTFEHNAGIVHCRVFGFCSLGFRKFPIFRLPDIGCKGTPIFFSAMLIVNCYCCRCCCRCFVKKISIWTL